MTSASAAQTSQRRRFGAIANQSLGTGPLRITAASNPVGLRALGKHAYTGRDRVLFRLPPASRVNANYSPGPVTRGFDATAAIHRSATLAPAAGYPFSVGPNPNFIATGTSTAMASWISLSPAQTIPLRQQAGHRAAAVERQAKRFVNIPSLPIGGVRWSSSSFSACWRRSCICRSP